MIQAASQILKKHFGYDQFRPMQEEIIQTVLDKKDALVLMPTGGGKSLCYQIPALMLEGTTIVVSPLISLMKDQVSALKANGIKAEYFNSTISYDQQIEIANQVRKGEIQMLYISPERLITTIDNVFKDAPISFIAIDEAHCVSMWGHDFRPEYGQLSALRKKMKHIPFLALTATADKATRNDIIEQLGLINPETFISSFNRKNLSLDVQQNVSKKEKIKQIVQFIKDRTGQSGIIYCLSRKGTEQLSEALNNAEIPAKAYHAGLDPDTRHKIQEDFVNDDLQIICATIAFGMGIDKSNVRWVIHFNLPKNIESYYQEIGRAGRDGLPSDTLLYFNIGDLMILSQFAAESAQSEILTEKLRRMQQLAESTSCRRRVLLSYFGEHLEENCGNCDVCKNPPTFFDGTVIAQKALSAIVRLQESVGSVMLINVLRGSKNKDLLDKRYDQIKTYGAGADHSYFEWQNYITQLMNHGAVEMAFDEHFVLKITPHGKEILTGKKTLELTKPILKNKKKKEKVEGKNLPDHEQLFEKLRKVRKDLSVEKNVPAYVIFHDSTLWEMVHQKPLTDEDLLAISGISEIKKNRYGEQFLDAIKQHVDGNLDTFEITYKLYKEGWSIDEICERRSLKKPTIFSHLAKLYLDGKDIDLMQYISSEELEKVRTAVNELGDTSALKPIYEHLKEEVPYEIIRIGITIDEKEKSGSISAE